MVKMRVSLFAEFMVNVNAALCHDSRDKKETRNEEYKWHFQSVNESDTQFQRAIGRRHLDKFARWIAIWGVEYQRLGSKWKVRENMANGCIWDIFRAATDRIGLSSRYWRYSLVLLINKQYHGICTIILRINPTFQTGLLFLRRIFPLHKSYDPISFNRATFNRYGRMFNKIGKMN